MNLTLRALNIVTSLLLVSVAAYYLFNAVVTTISQSHIEFSLILSKTLILPTLLAVAAGLINAYLWYKINKIKNYSTKFFQSVQAWSISRLFRYVPGKVFTYIVRHKLQGSTKKNSLIASINELIISYYPVFILVLIYFFQDFPYLILCAIILSFVTVINLRKVIKIFNKQIAQKLNDDSYNPNHILKALFLSFTAVAIHGLAFYIITTATHLDISFLEATTALYISSLLGQLALLVPAGLVVKEAAIVFFLTTLNVELEAALICASISRLALILSELVNATLSTIVLKLTK
ncbi:hypothetical protein HII17_10830 [Thalassotalea sp. M1531]|uniref:Flippase-like domain-containing protein n=1 Tax=Thalassotalea algicola TaxID=2716224 RepID=A0A7Y0LD94_9GAMM|nr:lysylphosphatidylglycerol synthase domain-containing protein [Thalassotalea algicola]NMP32063.1 hypothetical protein [Thalassotalea algicola]